MLTAPVVFLMGFSWSFQFRWKRCVRQKADMTEHNSLCFYLLQEDEGPDFRLRIWGRLCHLAFCTLSSGTLGNYMYLPSRRDGFYRMTDIWCWGNGHLVFHADGKLFQLERVLGRMARNNRHEFQGKLIILQLSEQCVLCWTFWGLF